MLLRQPRRVDRPVDANGKPFAIQSLNAPSRPRLQTGSRFHAALLDSRPADATTGNPQVSASIRLRSGTRSSPSAGPRSLVLFGDLEDGRITKGFLALTHDIYHYCRRCPIPYVGLLHDYRREVPAGGFGRTQQR